MAEIAALPHCARHALRGDADMLAAGCAAFGVGIPEPMRATRAGAMAALRLGPDEILLLGPEATPAPAAGIAVDVSARQVALALEGEGSIEMLAAGCPLDLAHLPEDGCTRTLFHKAEIVLWRTGPAAWRVEVWRSFAAYTRALLEQAALDWPAPGRPT